MLNSIAATNYYQFNDNQLPNPSQHTHILLRASSLDNVSQRLIATAKEKIILANLDSKIPVVMKAGQIQIVPLPQATYWKTFKTAAQKTYDTNKVWESIAMTVLALAVTVLAGGLYYLECSQIVHSYKNIDKLYNHYLDGTYIGSATYSKFDFVCDSLINGLTGLCTLLYMGTSLDSFARKNPFILHCAELRVQKYMHLLTIHTSGSSASAIDPEKIVGLNDDGSCNDLILLDRIEKDNLLAAQNFTFSNYLLPIQTALKSMFAKQLPLKNEELPHPIESRSLLPDEQAKFLEDLSNFFNIEKSNILKIWHFSKEEYAKYVQSVIHNIYGPRWNEFPLFLKFTYYKHLEKELIFSWRLKLFLRQLSPAIIHKLELLSAPTFYSYLSIPEDLLFETLPTQ